jgi:hypothetical protein
VRFLTDLTPHGPLLVWREEGENLWGRFTQGSADFVSLALGYYLSPRWGFEVNILFWQMRLAVFNLKS